MLLATIGFNEAEMGFETVAPGLQVAIRSNYDVGALQVSRWFEKVLVVEIEGIYLYRRNRG